MAKVSGETRSEGESALGALLGERNALYLNKGMDYIFVQQSLETTHLGWQWSSVVEHFPGMSEVMIKSLEPQNKSKYNQYTEVLSFAFFH